MNFDRSLIFSYLEEDNIQRAYFRVRPLLTLDGDIREEACQLWPNEGGLRIVPDRNEQHTFKVRMRTIGAYCVVDLREQPVEAGKIRTNKNFRPDRGEVNQYILYSDTVHELPEHTFYHLLNGSPDHYADYAKDSITPLFYIQDADTLYGPVRKDAPEKPHPAEEMAAMLYEIPCPDGATRIILCCETAQAKPEAEADSTSSKPKSLESTGEKHETKAEHHAQAEKEPTLPQEIPIGEELRILDTSKNHEETLEQLNQPVSLDANLLHQKDNKVPDAPPVAAAPAAGALSGTPLLRTPLHVSSQQNKNRTQEIVSNQWSVGKYEPPTQNLPAGMAMRSVNNPVESACSSLKEAWKTSAAHDQLLDYMLSLDGLRRKMEVKLCGGSCVTVMQRVLRQRLQDLEAERLMALCELDRARKDVDAYKQELIAALSGRISRETSKLEADCESAGKQCESLKQEINALVLQRDALLSKVNELQSSTLPEATAKLLADAQMTAPVSGIPLRLSPVSGQLVEPDEIFSRVLASCSESGVTISRNEAIMLTVLAASSSRIGLVSPTQSSLATLLGNVVTSLGWGQSYAHQYASEQHPLIGARPIDATPVLMATNLANYAVIGGVTKLTLSRSLPYLVKNAAYDVSPWPILSLPALPFVPELRENPGAAVSAASLERIVQAETVSSSELDSVLSPILNAAPPLSGAARKELYRFVSVCAGLMEGGLPVAADWGITLWVVPALERGSRSYAAVKSLLDEFPISLAKM